MVDFWPPDKFCRKRTHAKVHEAINGQLLDLFDGAGWMSGHQPVVAILPGEVVET